MNRRLKNLPAVMLALASASVAQPSMPDQQPGAQALPSIEVVGQRDPQFISYSDFFASIEKFQQLPERDGLSLILRVVPTQPDFDLGNLRVQLVGDHYIRAIPVSKGGRLEVPYDLEALNRRAEFVFNVKSGSLKPELNVLIKLDTLQIPYRELMAALQRADRAERALMTFGQRMMFPHSDAVAIGFGQGTKAVVTLASAKGSMSLVPNNKGIVGIKRDEQLVSENPMVTLSTAPDWVMAAIAASSTRDGN
jgi:hypothetical protein